ncbi:biotin transporter BioY [Acidipropionibacterium timonense]|uniref:biotin transporter BioY n=1 Tax=Acidipropionibacterium timonense TaxID=2161818 RepID=UPI001030EC8F|nr:biotin transporter BioY [Acidipropionibacterium timonense]
MSSSRRFQATDLALIAVFAALIAVLAIIPPLFSIGAVPFAIQMIGVMLAPLVLGGARGGSANALYALVGALGLPVFSGQTSGPGVLFGATGGYIWGFIIGGFLAGALATRIMRTRPRRAILPIWLYLVALVDLLVIYLCGTIGLMAAAGMKLSATLALNGPLLLIDLLKALVAVAVAVGVLTAFPRLMPTRRVAAAR